MHSDSGQHTMFSLLMKYKDHKFLILTCGAHHFNGH